MQKSGAEMRSCMRRNTRRLAAVLLAGLMTFAMPETVLTAQAEGETEVSADTLKVTRVNRKQAKSSGKVIKVNVKKGTDITKKVNAALETARKKATAKKKYTVVIPAGNYWVSSVLHIYSNTTLKATGATIKYKGPKKENHNLILSGDIKYNSSKKCKKYNGFKNITIEGGTWVGTTKNKANLVKIMHASNVTINGATFGVCGGIHQVEVCAIDGFSVTNCTFKNFKWNGVKGTKQEALQLDIPCSENVYGGTYQDGTTMKNVTVTGCKFQNVPRGIGSHTQLIGAYHKNIKIQNNTFDNVKEECIVTLNYYNCDISGNTIKNCGAGVFVQTFKQKYSSIYSSVSDGSYKKEKKTDLKTKIHDNTIQVKYNTECDAIQGIKLFGSVVKKKAKGADKKNVSTGDYRVTGVTIQDNRVTTGGHGIAISGAKNCQVTANTIIGKNYSKKDKNRKEYDGIIVSTSCSKIDISKNSIQSVARNGILVKTDCTVKKISGNTIAACGNTGIGIYDGSSVTKSISKNTISGAEESGILLSGKCTVPSVTGNIITSLKGNGINIYQSSKITGEISENTLKNIGKNGIIVNEKSTVAAVTSNELDKISSAGILVCNNAKITGKVQLNHIGSVGSDAIRITTGGKISGSTSNNTIDG
jgi:hypothetical protein